MAFDGNGNYIRIHNWTQDAANGLDINAGEMDAEDNSIQGAFNITVTRDGQGKMAADFTPGTTASYNLGTAGASWLNIAAKSGTIGPPASGIAWTVNAFSNTGSSNFNSIVGQPTFNTYSISGSAVAFEGVAAVAGNLVADSGIGDYVIRSQGGAIRFTINSGTSTAVEIDASGNLNASNGTAAIVGPLYAGIPQNRQTGSTYQLVLSDANKHIYQNAAGTHTYTIPANASVAFPIGTAITIVNTGGGAGALTIAITTDSLIWSANGASGSRTLANSGMATILKVDTGIWFISGTGLS